MQSGDLPLQTNSTLFFSKNIASSVKFFYVSRKFQENLQCPYSKFQRHKLNYLIRINKENILKSLCGLLCTERLATSLECITLINFWKSEGFYYKFTVLNTLGCWKVESSWTWKPGFPHSYCKTILFPLNRVMRMSTAQNPYQAQPHSASSRHCVIQNPFGK